jgi:DNA-binding NtrC family response regulator
MSGVVLLSTHDLEVAGGLREALEDGGTATRLVVSADDLEPSGEPALLVLTGKLEGPAAEEMAGKARGELHLPVFGVFPSGAEGVRSRARALGLEEVFQTPLDVDAVVLLARRALARKHLQRLTGIVGESDPIREALERVLQIARVDSTVLITGESGTGKELVARGIHALSPRRHNPFIPVNVAALSETLLESEIFGHAKGAFTGAIDSRRGLFELAHEGTIFLDEMGEMPLATQTKLLRVLEQREFLKVGGESPIRVDVRIIAATNQNLRLRVNTGEFRRDLYHRLNVLHIELPPLRQRREDIPLLVEHFVKVVSETHDRAFVGISDEAMEILMEYDWPGNVRELRNLVESMVVLAPGREILASDIPVEVRNGGGAGALIRVGDEPMLPVPSGEGGVAAGRAELEFIFRTMVDMRMDVDQLRSEFELYRRGKGVDPSGSITGGSDEPLQGFPAPSGEIRIHAPATGTGERLGSDGLPGAPDSGMEDEEAEVEVVASGSAAGTLALPDGAVVFRPGMTMEEMERAAIEAALEAVGGNRRKAARILGIGERTLYRKISKFGLDERP